MTSNKARARPAAAIRSQSARQRGSPKSSRRNAAGEPLRHGPVLPDALGVALDQFAQGMPQRFLPGIAGGQAVAADVEAAGRGRLRQAVVGMDQIVGQPDGLAGGEVGAFDPQERPIPVEARAGAQRQPFEVDQPPAAQFGGAGQPQGQLDPLRVPALDQFHQRPGAGGILGEALALAAGDGARVRPDGREHRHADAVEPGEVGQSGDAHRRHVRAYARDRFGRRNGAVGIAVSGMHHSLRLHGLCPVL